MLYSALGDDHAVVLQQVVDVCALSIGTRQRSHGKISGVDDACTCIGEEVEWPLKNKVGQVSVCGCTIGRTICGRYSTDLTFRADSTNNGSAPSSAESTTKQAAKQKRINTAKACRRIGVRMASGGKHGEPTLVEYRLCKVTYSR